MPAIEWVEVKLKHFLINLKKEALEMEKHQMPQGILSIGEKPEITFLEISDEEIDDAAFFEIKAETANGFIKGAKWYRKQLKQRK
jgi:hypothetical protein